MRWRIPLVVLLALFVASSCDQTQIPAEPELPAAEANFDVTAGDFPARPVLGPGETTNWTPPPTLSFLESNGGLTTADLNSVAVSQLVDILLGCASPGCGGTGEPDVTNITSVSVNHSAGTFAGGTGIIDIASGVILSSGNIASVPGPNTSPGITTINSLSGDPDLDGLIPGYTTFDATKLEFDFECSGATDVEFRYVFSSDEYNEYVCSSYNDVFGWFLNGSNIALLPGGTTPVAINTVNGGNPLVPGCTASNPTYYRNNDIFYPPLTTSPINTEMDGLTTVLTASGPLVPGVNHIKLAVADAGDQILDSNVFLEGSSFECFLPVKVDIKPGSDPNCVNPDGGGRIAVAILDDAGYDINEVDPETVRLEGVEPVKWAFNKDVGGGPGNDLVFHFNNRDLSAFLFDGAELMLTGLTYDLFEVRGVGVPSVVQGTIDGASSVWVFEPGLDVCEDYGDVPKIRIEADIDGRSQLILSGKTAQWHHFDYAAPGRLDTEFYSCPAVSEPTIINKDEWYPVWPDDPTPENRDCNCSSDLYEGVRPPVPSSDLTPVLNAIQYRWLPQIVQNPSAANGYTTIIEFDDNGFSCADTYIVEVSFP
jgi:hypothetical protein